MTKREVVQAALEGVSPPYVPWSFGFTTEAEAKLIAHYGTTDLDTPLQNHILTLGNDIGFFEDVGNDRVQDVFGVVWNRSVDRDIGVVEGCVLPDRSVAGLEMPDPLDPRFFRGIPEAIEEHGDRYRVFSIGFSLYERAWTLRGMEALLVDFLDSPGFVRELFDLITDYNIAQAREALTYDIDAVYFGDDWGQQRGLLMGPDIWKQFIHPCLRRMYTAVRETGRRVFIHSCGDVDELFDDLVDIGLDCFNPFQPEVMDVEALLAEYSGRLSFHGGISTQRTLPYGTRDDVRRAVRHLIDLGGEGGLVIAPAHDVEGDVPLENMLALIDEVKRQPEFHEPV